VLTEWRERLTAARTGHLATVRPDGRPHVVVCCHAVDGDVVYTAVDAKPKTTTALQRLRNVDANPWASLLVDHYDEDWSALWWVRVDGPARLVDDDGERGRALAALAGKYEQYGDRPPTGPVLAIEIEAVRSWPAPAPPGRGTPGPPGTPSSSGSARRP
jgi:PPOX class probable F420-dependent enzyme